MKGTPNPDVMMRRTKTTDYCILLDLFFNKNFDLKSEPFLNMFNCAQKRIYISPQK